jgi:hypothetical protein
VEIQKADRVARKKAMVFIVAVGAISSIAFMLVALNSSIVDSWVQHLVQNFVNSPHLIPFAATIGITPCWFFAIYLFAFALRVSRAR